jgi:hypothetical protein
MEKKRDMRNAALAATGLATGLVFQQVRDGGVISRKQQANRLQIERNNLKNQLLHERKARNDLMKDHSVLSGQMIGYKRLAEMSRNRAKKELVTDGRGLVVPVVLGGSAVGLGLTYILIGEKKRKDIREAVRTILFP